MKGFFSAIQDFFFFFSVVLVVYSGVSVFGNELVSSLFNLFFSHFFFPDQFISRLILQFTSLIFFSSFSVSSFLAPVA